MSKDYETTGVLSSGEMDPFRQAIPVLSSTLDLLFESDSMKIDSMRDGSLRGDTDYNNQKSVLNSQNGQNGGDYCEVADEKSKWSTEETATLSSAACRSVLVFTLTLIIIT